MSEFLEKQFAFHLYIGVPPETFWDGDYTLLPAYRAAYRLRVEKENQMLWLQGLYIYEALCNVSPIFRFGSKATKPVPYRSEPFPLTQKERQEQKEREEEKNAERLKAGIDSFAARFNKKFKQSSGGASDGE